MFQYERIIDEIMRNPELTARHIGQNLGIDVKNLHGSLHSIGTTFPEEQRSAVRRLKAELAGLKRKLMLEPARTTPLEPVKPNFQLVAVADLMREQQAGSK